VKFNDSIDKWFDRVADKPCKTDTGIQEVRRIVNDSFERCSKTKLLKVQVWLKRSSAPWKDDVLDTIKQISLGTFKPEFRYSYNGNQVGTGGVRQASCFFSLLKQALNYHRS